MRLLVITDHNKHSQRDSLYPLLEDMDKDRRCTSIDLISRGNKENADFFECRPQNKVYINRIDDEFKFDVSLKFFENPIPVSIEAYDVVLVRIDRPVTNEFLKYIKETFKDKIIINDPEGIKTTGSKDFLVNFREHCPPIRLCYDFLAIKEFKAQFPIVLKPLDNYGGRGIVKITDNRYECEGKIFSENEFEKAFAKNIQQGYLAMKYLSNVDKGDKRIVIINEAIVGSTLRIPKEGSWICNLSQGAKTVETSVDQNEQHIVDSIAPTMTAHGIIIYGIDTLVDDSGKRVLSEINTLNVGGLIQAQESSGMSIIKIASKLIWDYIDENK